MPGVHVFAYQVPELSNPYHVVARDPSVGDAGGGGGLSLAALDYDDEVVIVLRKNVAGQNVAGQVNDRTTGAPLTASVSVLVTGDGGTQIAGGGTLTHEGNGHWNYAPTQAETNFNHVAVTFTHASGVHKTYNVYTVAYDPYDTAGLGLSRIDAAITSRMATFTLPANFASLSITAAGLVDMTQAAADKVWTAAARTLTSFGFSVTVGTNADKTGYDLTPAARDAIANAALDLAAAIETGLTLRQALRLVGAALAGKISGAAGTTVTIRNAVADTKDRIVATVDADGNRTAITYDTT